MRGGVTIDDICFEGSMVFGPAMNKAYRLESEFAVYPRIVIDPAVFEAHEKEPLPRNDIHDVATEHEYFHALVRRGTDGIYFIDYLRGMVTEFDEEGMEFDFFAMHKDRIVESAAKHKKLNTVAAKYLWLATYHNTFMREIGEEQFAERGFDIDDYLISSDEMPHAGVSDHGLWAHVGEADSEKEGEQGERSAVTSYGICRLHLLTLRSGDAAERRWTMRHPSAYGLGRHIALPHEHPATGKRYPWVGPASSPPNAKSRTRSPAIRTRSSASQAPLRQTLSFASGCVSRRRISKAAATCSMASALYSRASEWVGR